MGRRKAGGESREARETRERNLATVRMAHDALRASPVDCAGLRKVAALRGLVDAATRRAAWPRLLGVVGGAGAAARDATARHFAVGEEAHKDVRVVEVDVARSLWHVADDEEREKFRAQLARLLDGVVGAHAAHVSYYQGLHDVAAVLLLVVGEDAAYALLERLVVHHLRDCTRPTLAPVMRVLELLYPLLRRADAELAAHLEAAQVPPYFAVSWLLTWHAHELKRLEDAARLFDLFLASSPLMPLYTGVASLTAARERLLALPADVAELHQALVDTPVLGVLDADSLARRALALHRNHPRDVLEKDAGRPLPRCSAARRYPFPWHNEPQPPAAQLRASPPAPPPDDPVERARAVPLDVDAEELAEADKETSPETFALAAAAAAANSQQRLSAGAGALAVVGTVLAALYLARVDGGAIVEPEWWNDVTDALITAFVPATQAAAV